MDEDGDIKLWEKKSKFIKLNVHVNLVENGEFLTFDLGEKISSHFINWFPYVRV